MQNRTLPVRTLLCGLAALGMTTGCVQNRTLGAGIDDVGADLSMKRRLFANRDIDTSDVDVSVFEGRLLLAGTVPDQATHQALLAEVRRVGGVGEVIDEVRVAEQTSMRQGAADALIDQRLGAALLTDSGIYRNNYQIVVSQGIVYLLGVAQGPNELQRVIAQAEAVPGVREVVSHGAYVGDPRRRTQR